MTLRQTIALATLGLVQWLAPLGTAHAASCTDTAAVAAARAAIESACPCPDGTDRRTYVKCASDVTKARVGDGSLPKACAGGVKRCAKNSTCGKPGTMPCCTTNAAGRTTCKVTTPDRCTARGGCTSSVSSCCDACGPSGCTAVCGNGVIESGESCDGEVFCHPTGCYIPFESCCEITHDSGVCSLENDPSMPTPCSVFGPTAVTKLGRTSAGTTSCASGLFPYSEYTVEGGCSDTVTTFPPVSVCCDFFAAFGGPCTDATVSDAAALAQFQTTCSHTAMATVGYFAKVGTCGPNDTCVPTH